MFGDLSRFVFYLLVEVDFEGSFFELKKFAFEVRIEL